VVNTVSGQGLSQVKRRAGGYYTAWLHPTITLSILKYKTSC